MVKIELIVDELGHKVLSLSPHTLTCKYISVDSTQCVKMVRMELIVDELGNRLQSSLMHRDGPTPLETDGTIN